MHKPGSSSGFCLCYTVSSFLRPFDCFLSVFVICLLNFAMGLTLFDTSNAAFVFVFIVLIIILLVVFVKKMQSEVLLFFSIKTLLCTSYSLPTNRKYLLE